MGGLSFFGDGLFAYLSSTSLSRKVADAFMIMTVFTWVAGIYLVATNYSSIKQVFGPKIDVTDLIKLDKGINDILSLTMVGVAADRGSLSRFHNTVTDLQGRHFVFMSRANEVVQPGVSYAARLQQNVLLSLINIWAQSFVKNECVYMSEIAPTDQFYEFYRQIGTKSVIKCPVFNTSNSLMGYINMEYVTRSVPVPEMKAKESAVRAAAAQIGAILSIGGTAAEYKSPVQIQLNKLAEPSTLKIKEAGDIGPGSLI